MVSKNVAVVYLAGLLQGLTLVCFPATSSIFTNPHEFNLSSAEYGGLFVPQAALSIIAALLSNKFAQSKSLKSVFLFGLAANLLSMLLLGLSALFIKHPAAAYGILLLATASLGIGFGLTVPSLNNFAALFFPKKIDSALLVLNALLGLGTALAPLLVVIFIKFGFWWGLPALLALLLLALLLYSSPLALQGKTQNKPSDAHHTQKSPLPRLFWLFAAFALLYGFLETINGNWATLYMQKNLHTTTGLASLALALFWTMVTVGRIFFSVIARFFSSRSTFCLLPFVIAIAFLIISFLSFGKGVVGVFGKGVVGVLAFGLAGLGCSALLPLIISFGDRAFPTIQTSIAGNLIALYLLGYGIAAFGIGSLQDWAGWGLPTLFGFGTGLAIILGILAFMIKTKIPSKELKTK